MIEEPKNPVSEKPKCPSPEKPSPKSRKTRFLNHLTEIQTPFDP
jgi:hypothetical protein